MASRTAFVEIISDYVEVNWDVEKVGQGCIFTYLKTLHIVYKVLEHLFLNLCLCIISKDPHDWLPPIKIKSYWHVFIY